jgi:Sec-independent protein translocase protein TatA
VGYFVLGPSDLYKLVKEIGKFIQNIRTLGTDLTTTLESNMESQLQLEELRKAQRELNDAFSFRRSINTDEDEEEAFSTTVTTPRPAIAESDGMTVTNDGTTKKKSRRRVRRKSPSGTDTPTAANSGGAGIPDLEMPTSNTAAATTATTVGAAKPAGSTDGGKTSRPTDPFIEYSDEELAKIDEEFDKYVSMDDSGREDDDNNSNKDEQSSEMDWFSEPAKSQNDAVSTPTATDPQMDAMAQSRFQQQLSGTWNEQIMANEEKLEPLAKVMQLLASLEEEKIASTKRLEEEFRKRAELEEEFYQKQRRALEEAAVQVQEAASAGLQQTSSKA